MVKVSILECSASAVQGIIKEDEAVTPLIDLMIDFTLWAAHGAIESFQHMLSACVSHT